MDGRTTQTVDSGRQFDWPPRDSVIAESDRHPSRSAWDSPRDHAAHSGDALQAGHHTATGADDNGGTGPERWRRGAARAAAIGTIGAIALLGQGSATSRRERNPPIATPRAAAHAPVPAAPIAEPAAETARGAGRLTVPGPAGARVWLDGAPRGTAPLSIADLAPGEHEVRVKTNAAVASARVLVAAGSTANVVISTPAQGSPGRTAASPPSRPTPPLPAPGTVAVALPFTVQIFEDGRFAGTNSTELMLPPGPHRLELVNRSLDYRAIESVQVESGKVAKIPAAPPMGRVSLNALPWGEVFIDGHKVGETPLGQVPIALGAHDIVFRHPQLGEQSRSITVAAGAPTRISVDLRK
jgi:hypothetical protein